MISKLNFITVTILLLACLSSCRSVQELPSEYAGMNFSAECIGTDQSGIQTLRVWGKGINKSTAIAQALRNAVSTVLFDGVSGTGDCDKRPIVAIPNTREVHEAYFSEFFANGGAYTEYVNLDEKRTSRIKSESSTMELWSVTVDVNRRSLRDRLINDGILK